MKAAIVVTTYNNPKYLGICLKSFSNQTHSDFDLFVADDGSRDETRVKIDALRPELGFKLEHVWHPDTGYKKSQINNEVFRRLGAYSVVICVDHDVIAHRQFVEDHLSMHRGRPRAVLMGRRVELGPRISASITEENVTRFNHGVSFALLQSALQGDTPNASRAFRITNPLVRRLLGRDNVPDLLGSNFSISRELLWEVNGYNEDYQAYWGEDGDLFVRLRNSGATIVGRKSFAIQYHLDHKRLDPAPEHVARYQELLKDTSYVRCKNGIAKA
jgi:glycosyltransferase involved in cell wall biosynthesis